MNSMGYYITPDELNEYDNISITIDSATWIGEDIDDLSDEIADITHRITNGDFTHQILWDSTCGYNKDSCSNSIIWNGIWYAMIHTSNDKDGGVDDPCDDWSHHPIPKPKKEDNNGK